MNPRAGLDDLERRKKSQPLPGIEPPSSISYLSLRWPRYRGAEETAKCIPEVRSASRLNLYYCQSTPRHVKLLLLNCVLLWIIALHWNRSKVILTWLNPVWILVVPRGEGFSTSNAVSVIVLQSALLTSGKRNTKTNVPKCFQSWVHWRQTCIQRRDHVAE